MKWNEDKSNKQNLIMLCLIGLDNKRQDHCLKNLQKKKKN